MIETRPSGVDPMASTQFSPSQLAELDQPQVLLQEPEPHTKLGQQVGRLEQHGLHKSAQYVKTCGRLVEKLTYACGRSFPGIRIRAHLRFCCIWCEKYVATRLFEEHRAYRERLQPSGTLYLITARSIHSSLSKDGIRDFEDAFVAAIRQWLNTCKGWGSKSYTHYLDGELLIKGIIALPPGAALPPNDLTVPFADCVIGDPVGVTAFEALLAEILKPVLTEGRGLLRADLMAAFQGGNHLRSLGSLYGLISKNRGEKALEQNRGNLDLSIKSSDGLGTALARSSGFCRRHLLMCPHCGLGCQLVSVSSEPISELPGILVFEDSLTEHTWNEMKALLRRNCRSQPLRPWERELRCAPTVSSLAP